MKSLNYAHRIRYLVTYQSQKYQRSMDASCSYFLGGTVPGQTYVDFRSALDPAAWRILVGPLSVPFQ